jgi:nitrilase
MFDVEVEGNTYEESATMAPGEEVVMASLAGAPVGLTLCYDLRFPELYRRLAAWGARLVTVPAAFTMETGRDHWEVLLRARAIETETFVCAAAQTGAHNAGNEKRFTYGHSLVIDPWGHVVAKASDGVGVVSSRIDPSLVGKVRAQIPVHQHKVLI